MLIRKHEVVGPSYNEDRVRDALGIYCVRYEGVKCRQRHLPTSCTSTKSIFYLTMMNFITAAPSDTCRLVGVDGWLVAGGWFDLRRDVPGSVRDNMLIARIAAAVHSGPFD